jgi:signal transduction histidine kinase
MRFSVITSIFTGIVLILLNIFCAYFTQDLFYRSKQVTMVEKALLTAEEIGNADALTYDAASAVLERLGGFENMYLMVTDTAGQVLYDSSGLLPADQLIDYPRIQRALEGQDVFAWRFDQGVVRSEAAVPIVGYNAISGCLYMMESDSEQGRFMQYLQEGILLVSILLELLMVLFSLTYARRFSSRLKKILNSMHIIQNGNYTHKLTLDGNDELTMFGDEFNDLTRRLRDSEEKRRQFVSDASHELKTPLASIKLLTDSILQNEMDPETTREFVEDIGNEAERLNRMTSKLLSLTKGEADSVITDAEIIQMAPTIQKVAKMLSSIAQETNVRIQLDLQKDSSVLVREDDLYQIAYNLVENGIKYNVPGGTLTISLLQESDLGILKVTDTGMGIPPESQQHVFERFYRVDKARSRQHGGSGLGLAIVHSMVERNGGEIQLESSLGKGTTFTVSFPRFDLEDTFQ